jgi:GAF domain-containing protein
VAAARVREILSAVWATCPDGSGLPAALAELCVRVLPVTGAGLSLMTEAGPASTVTATDACARELEELQFSLGEGPCVDASRTGRPVLQPDLARTAPARWPAFAIGASDAGLRAVFAFPLRVGAIRVGALDLHRDVVGVLSPGELTEALAFTDAATALMLQLQAQAAGTDLPLESLAVLDDRAEVHQAAGVVSVHAGVSLVEALVLLRARAHAEQRAVGDLARDVLAGVVRFRPDREHE